MSDRALYGSPDEIAHLLRETHTWAVVGLSFLFWGWFERRQRRVRSARAREGLGVGLGATSPISPDDADKTVATVPA